VSGLINRFREIRHVISQINFTWPPADIVRGSGICLDLGCGTARHRDMIEEAGFSWIGADLHVRCEEDKFLLVNAHNIPFKDDSFELIFMNGFLEHVANPWKVVQEVNRCVKKGGYVQGIVAYLDPDSTHFWGFGKPGLSHLLEENGFHDVTIRPGIISFSSILRKFLFYSGWKKSGTALSLTRLWLVPFLYTYLTALSLFWFIKGRELTDTGFIKWLKDDFAFEFAGHIEFMAQKR